jgi:hypothetical protein
VVRPPGSVPMYNAAPPSCLTATRLAGVFVMRVNIWIVLAALLALLVVARYLQQLGDAQVCVDDPTAAVCHR